MSEVDSSEVWLQAGEAAANGRAGVVVTLMGARGSIPGTVGAKALVGESGIQVGNLGGGKVEAAVIREAHRLQAEDGPMVQAVTWNLQRDLGMTCGGEVSFLFERLGGADSWHIVVCGAGHVAQALVPLLASLPCRIDVVDPRPEWLSRVRPHLAVSTHGGEDYLSAARQVIRPHSFVICVTQGHGTDLPIVRWVLESVPEVPFLGVIGSEVKRAKLMSELRAAQLGEDLLEKVTCPLGLPIGGNHPSEIAISIAAQLLEKRAQF
ncbi:XdhC family protein [Roseibacillus persicicus]|uniref:XdhC family protein n=1 Tax=Roseibacillus persicicus TaxID=454148 RepID=UPI00280CDDCC|nr:XdhC family protein [Roseibacillus persicicus]MDQ8189731.1 XdhC family protein [Roseibacillus persicicus]